MDYALCDRVVTLYRNTPSGISRQVVKRAWLFTEMGFVGKDREPVRKFLLIIPGEETALFPGDRVYDGIGPMEVDWQTFLPICDPRLVEVGKVREFRFNGKILHREAEQGWN